ncbi:Pr6Pr family membrane protein, partial [Arachidicoccus sp.]|uniref:Pr6Pr family membrane protein n=1 Tax=Arachidicoccus sp. TaxID=1872624 RepID=UPI003D1B5A0E
ITMLPNNIHHIFTVLWLNKNNRLHQFFSRPSTLTATTVYIIVVAAVYNIILRRLGHPQGLFKLADELLHSVVPFLVLLFWWLYVPKKSLEWRQLWSWLPYPLAYLIYTFIHGIYTNYYPYPFVDVTALGYQKVFINCLAMTLVFLLFSLLFIAINRGRKKTKV